MSHCISIILNAKSRQFRLSASCQSKARSQNHLQFWHLLHCPLKRIFTYTTSRNIVFLFVTLLLRSSDKFHEGTGESPEETHICDWLVYWLVDWSSNKFYKSTRDPHLCCPLRIPPVIWSMKGLTAWHFQPETEHVITLREIFGHLHLILANKVFRVLSLSLNLLKHQISYSFSHIIQNLHNRPPCTTLRISAFDQVCFWNLKWKWDGYGDGWSPGGVRYRASYSANYQAKISHQKNVDQN